LAIGMFGCIATQVQPKIVTKQLQIIFQIVLQWPILLHKPAGMDWSITADQGGYNLSAYALAILWHI
jgi:hypothetical protein